MISCEAQRSAIIPVEFPQSTHKKHPIGMSSMSSYFKYFLHKLLYLFIRYHVMLAIVIMTLDC